MDVRRFFTAQQLTDLHSLYTKWNDFLNSEQWTPIAPQMDFPNFQTTAMFGYVLGEQASAQHLLQRAVDGGFPPDWKFEVKDDHDREWKNYQDGVCALDVALAAHILGMKGRRDEILAWTVERLLDTEMFTRDSDPQYSCVVLARSYALLAAGRFWPRMDADLAFAAGHIHKSTDNTCDWALPKTLTALVQCKKGNASRQHATTSLVQLIKDSKRDVYDRAEACFHVLYLQSAFPDVFDPVLPPLVVLK